MRRVPAYEAAIIGRCTWPDHTNLGYKDMPPSTTIVVPVT